MASQTMYEMKQVMKWPHATLSAVTKQYMLNSDMKGMTTRLRKSCFFTGSSAAKENPSFDAPLFALAMLCPFVLVLVFA